MSDSDMPKLDPPAIASAEKKKGGWPKGKPRGKKIGSTTVKEEKPNAVIAIDESRLLTDEEVGRFMEGIFSVAALPLGNHWMLFPPEATSLGRCFGPIMRRYPEKLGPWTDLLICGPAFAAVVMPRVGLQMAIQKGQVKKEEARDRLSMVLSYLDQVQKQQQEAMKEQEKPSMQVVNG